MSEVLRSPEMGMHKPVIEAGLNIEQLTAGAAILKVIREKLGFTQDSQEK